MLLIDDAPEILTLYGNVLKHEGFEVRLAHGPLEAFAILESFEPDLVILDFMMPQMNGEQVLRELRKRPSFADTAVIFLTAMGQDEGAIGVALDLGANDFLSKPVDRRLLVAKVAALVDARRRDNLRRAYDELAEAQRVLLADLERARKVQTGYLPPSQAHFGEFSFRAVLEPCEHVGGDLYDVIETRWGTITVLLDVSGHGLAAALVSAGIRSTLRLLLHTKSLRDALAELNRQMCMDNDDHYVCVAMVLCDGTSMRVVNAGLPPVVRLERGRVTACVLATGMPPGLVADAEYEETVWRVDPGTDVVMVSDGFAELFEDVEAVERWTTALDLSPIALGRPQRSLEECVGDAIRESGGKLRDDGTVVVLSVGEVAKASTSSLSMPPEDADPAEVRFSIPPHVEVIPRALSIAARAMDRDPEDPEVRAPLWEALLNAVIHGSLGVDSPPRDRELTGFLAEVRRAERNAAPGRTVAVSVIAADDGYEVAITDPGDGFRWQDFAERTGQLDSTSEGGRGIAIMRAGSSVSWNEKGNQVRLKFPHRNKESQ
ncbi:MAG TPA: SpoIIE family protein phosphatase [Polyangiaceae bacterium]